MPMFRLGERCPMEMTWHAANCHVYGPRGIATCTAKDCAHKTSGTCDQAFVAVDTGHCMAYSKLKLAAGATGADRP